MHYSPEATHEEPLLLKEKQYLMRVKKQVDEAKAQYNRSLAEYEDAKDTIYLNVKKNYLDLQTAKESIIIAKLALDEAKEQYRQVTGRYKAGVGDAIELKDGENTYLNARLDFYNAMLKYNILAASLEKEVGVPLERGEAKIITDICLENVVGTVSFVLQITVLGVETVIEPIVGNSNIESLYRICQRQVQLLRVVSIGDAVTTPSRER